MRSVSGHQSSTQTLEKFHNLLKKTILNHQHPVTGLFPAALNGGHLDQVAPGMEHAWVRNNVYTVLSVWALSLAYRKNTDLDEHRAITYELEQCAVKTMRGLLRSMILQADKLEQFKSSQKLENALHAKYSCETGQPVVSDTAWGHLQLDATSLFLLILAEMTVSGLQIIFTLDEVDFIQNLVYYIEPSYQTPDYGIWERGDKTNHGLPELNSSSIGMAKAALEAMRELDLFGSRGGPASTIHVLPDKIKYCKAVLESMLPKESISKETGAALLSIISYPAFAIEDEALVDITRDCVITKLEGRYGCCRFLRDGYKTPKEDSNRLHYEPSELKIFENIESEWPMFFLYLILDGFFNQRDEQVHQYFEKLEDLVVHGDEDLEMIPELYFVEPDKVQLEYEDPHSQARVCSDRCPHLWSQSLYVICCLLKEGLVAVGDLDPLNRRYSTAAHPDLVVQVALLAKNAEVARTLLDAGIPCQTFDDAAPVRVLPARYLSRIFSKPGKNNNLKLSGRASQDIGLFSTAALYRTETAILAFNPQFLDHRHFYLSLDNELLADAFKTEIEHLRSNWNLLGRPTLTVPISSHLLGNSMDSSIGKLLFKLKNGYFYGVRVRMGILSELLSTSCIFRLDFFSDADIEDMISAFHLKRMPRNEPKLLSPTIHSGTTFNFVGSGQEDKLTRNPLWNKVQGVVQRSRSLSKPTASWVGVLDESDEDTVPERCQLKPLEWSGSASKSIDAEREHSLEQLVQQLLACSTLQERADILHYLYETMGPDAQVALYEGHCGCKLEHLLKDLYNQAGKIEAWFLIRHTAGLLSKEIENLSQAANDLLSRQKQFTVGLTHLNMEHIIARPLPPKELKDAIYKACGKDKSLAVLTQELMVYLAMFIKTHPALFEVMLRLRVGLIIEVMLAEFCRASGLSGMEAADHFMNLSPYQMKSLLYHTLSSKEFSLVRGESGFFTLEGKGSFHHVRDAIKSLGSDSAPDDDQGSANEDTLDREDNIGGYTPPLPAGNCNRLGVWYRRRCLDGALNRVPQGFYGHVWTILEKSNGLSFCNQFLPNDMVQEMTAGEMKFALRVESALNHVAEPEYRQLLVEVVEVFHQMLLMEEETPKIWTEVRLDGLITEANELFLMDQTQCNAEAMACCAGRPAWERSCTGVGRICQFFYDSAPSGLYGTLTYFAKVVINRFSFCSRKQHQDTCKIS